MYPGKMCLQSDREYTVYIDNPGLFGGNDSILFQKIRPVQSQAVFLKNLQLIDKYRIGINDVNNSVLIRYSKIILNTKYIVRKSPARFIIDENMIQVDDAKTDCMYVFEDLQQFELIVPFNAAGSTSCIVYVNPPDSDIFLVVKEIKLPPFNSKLDYMFNILQGKNNFNLPQEFYEQLGLDLNNIKNNKYIKTLSNLQQNHGTNALYKFMSETPKDAVNLLMMINFEYKAEINDIYSHLLLKEEYDGQIVCDSHFLDDEKQKDILNAVYILESCSILDVDTKLNYQIYKCDDINNFHIQLPSNSNHCVFYLYKLQMNSFNFMLVKTFRFKQYLFGETLIIDKDIKLNAVNCYHPMIRIHCSEDIIVNKNVTVSNVLETAAGNVRDIIEIVSNKSIINKGTISANIIGIKCVNLINYQNISANKYKDGIINIHCDKYQNQKFISPSPNVKPINPVDIKLNSTLMFKTEKINLKIKKHFGYNDDKYDKEYHPKHLLVDNTNKYYDNDPNTKNKNRREIIFEIITKGRCIISEIRLRNVTWSAAIKEICVYYSNESDYKKSNKWKQLAHIKNIHNKNKDHQCFYMETGCHMMSKQMIKLKIIQNHGELGHDRFYYFGVYGWIFS
eukprot:125506_1